MRKLSYVKIFLGKSLKESRKERNFVWQQKRKGEGEKEPECTLVQSSHFIGNTSKLRTGW